MKNINGRLLTLFEGVVNYNLISPFKTLAPTELQINLTYRCNSKCQMCQIWKMKPKREMSYREWKEIMKDPIFSTVRRLTIAGGEPLLHSHLAKMTKLFLDSMPQLQFLGLVTNGLLTEKTVEQVKKIATLAKRKGVNFSVTVSLDGVGKASDVLRGVPGGFKKASETVLALNSLRPKHDFFLGVSGVLCHQNLHQIKELEDWCQEQGVYFNYQPVGFHETYVQNLTKKKALDFRKEDKPFLFALFRRLAKPSSPLNPRAWLKSYYWHDMLNLYRGGKRTTPCPFLLDAFVLDAFGDVYYCLSEKKIGNCREGKRVSKLSLLRSPKSCFSSEVSQEHLPYVQQ